MESEQPIHSEATLLPGYASQTLTSEEQQQVENHLKICSTCQNELQEVKTMKAALKTVIQDFPGPSPTAFSMVMNRIHQETQTAPQQNQHERNASWGEWIENALRSIFEVRWAPALASCLIVGQAMLLFSVLSKPQVRVETQSGPIITRGIPQVTTIATLMKIQVRFVESAQEQEIRGVILELGGQIVSGPTDEGLYTLGFPQAANTSSKAILTALKTYPKLIKTAAFLPPSSE